MPFIQIPPHQTCNKVVQFSTGKQSPNKHGLYTENWWHNYSKVGQFAKSDRQLCGATNLHDKVAHFFCMPDMGLNDPRNLGICVSSLHHLLSPHLTRYSRLSRLMVINNECKQPSIKTVQKTQILHNNNNNNGQH